MFVKEAVGTFVRVGNLTVGEELLSGAGLDLLKRI